MNRGSLIIQKIVASLLVLVIILSHSAIVGITALTYAVDLIATNSDNVEIRAYFVVNNEETTQIQSKIDEKNLKLNIEVAVRNEGYLNGQISFVNSGFKIDSNYKNEYIDEIRDNVIYLKQINADEIVKLQIGIQAINQEKIESKSLNIGTKVTLTGTYFSSKENKQIRGESEVNVIWRLPEDTKAQLSGKILTNYIYKVREERKKVVQFLISSKIANNNYPVKNTEIIATVPEGVDKVEVHKRTTNATNGNKEFTQDNYKVENSLLKINVQNPEVDGTINWNKNSRDIFVVTYEFKDDKDLSNENVWINSNITMYDNNQTVVRGEQQQIELKEEKQGIVTVDKKEKEEEIYKGKIYSGEERDYTTYTKIYVDYAEGVKQLRIKEDEPVYVREDEKIKANIQYKELKFNKANVSSILGDTWEITIKENNSERKLSNETQADENGNIVIKFNDEVMLLDIITSDVKSNGILLFETTKKILDSKYKREDLQTLTGIQDNTEVAYTDNEEKIFNANKVSMINLNETKTEARIEIEQQSLTSSKEQQELHITTVLETDSEEKDLYKNPELKITIPKQINVAQAQTKLLYANGLKIESENFKIEKEKGQSIIKMALNGEQEIYQGQAIEGTKVLINAKVDVKEQKEDTTGEITLNYTNENATTYSNNGVQKANIRLLAATPEEPKENENTETQNKSTESTKQNEGNNNQNTTQDNKQNESTTNTNEENNKKNEELKYSLKAKIGGEEIKEGDTVKAGEIIVYELDITNSGTQKVENINLEATIPEDTTLIGVNPNYPAWDEEVGEYIDGEEFFIEKEETKLKKESVDIESGKVISLSYMVKVKTDLAEEKVSETNISIKKDNEEIKQLKYSNKLEPGTVEVTCMPVFREPNIELEAETKYIYEIHIKNLTEEELKNVEVTINKSDVMKITGYSWYLDEENFDYLDESNMTFTLGSIPANKTVKIIINANMQLSQNDSLNDKQPPYFAQLSAKVKDASSNIYKSNFLSEEVVGVIMRASITAELTQNVKSAEYVNIGDKIKYTIKLKNIGKVNAEKMVIDDIFSDYLNLLKISLNGKECEYDEETIVGDNNDYNIIHIDSQLKSGEEATIEITGQVDSNIPNENKNLEVRNMATIYNDGAKIAQTDEIRYIIKKVNNIENGEINKEESKKLDNTNNISGVAWLDENQDGNRDLEEQLLKGIKVYAIDVSNNKVATDTDGEDIIAITDDKGEYVLENLVEGNYIVAFEFDTQKYMVTQYKRDGVGEDKNSDAVKATRVVDEEQRTLAYTDTLDLSTSKSNIDLGLIKARVFDLELQKVISKVTIINKAGTKVKKFNDTNLAKVEIGPKKLNGSKVVIEYKIKIKNTGEETGNVKEIVDYIPSSLTFDSTLNKDWYKSGNNIYNNSLANKKIKPGEIKTIKLLLIKTMTESNTGLTHNTAEIEKYDNTFGILDKDSVAGNKKAGEDDIGSADIIISVSTGRTITYLGITLAIVCLLGVVTYIMIQKNIHIKDFYKEGGLK